MGTPASPGCGGGGGDNKNKDMKTQQSLEQQPHQGPRDFRSRLASRGGVRKEKPLTGDLGNSQSCPVPSGTQPGNVSSPPSCQGSRPRKQRSPKEPLDTDKNLRTKTRSLIGLFPAVGGVSRSNISGAHPCPRRMSGTQPVTPPMTCAKSGNLTKAQNVGGAERPVRSHDHPAQPRRPQELSPACASSAGRRQRCLPNSTLTPARSIVRLCPSVHVCH